MATAFFRPEPLPFAEAAALRPVDRRTPPERAADALAGGERLRLADTYDVGVTIQDALRTRLPPPPRDAPFAEKRAAEKAFRAAAKGLYVPIRDHRWTTPGTGTSGFFAELYPELGDFALPLIEAQELYGAWRRYEQGVHLAVLGRRLHPFYGTYLPTRTEHLELFATWLSGWSGGLERAIDVGTGSGVLALLLARNGFEEVLATDTNPNAVESVRREVQRPPAMPQVRPELTSLLGEGTEAVDLVVFNPPWVEGPVESFLDLALSYEPGLFETFFDQAHQRLSPEGRIALIFSTVGSLLSEEGPHPIEAELERGRFVRVDHRQRRIKPPKGSGRRTRERVEIWELARA